MFYPSSSSTHLLRGASCIQTRSSGIICDYDTPWQALGKLMEDDLLEKVQMEVNGVFWILRKTSRVSCLKYAKLNLEHHVRPWGLHPSPQELEEMRRLLQSQLPPHCTVEPEDAERWRCPQCHPIKRPSAWEELPEAKKRRLGRELTILMRFC